MVSVKVSVIMTTYNGSSYITQQLESIRLQTRKPDEVIIIDDNSSDDTFIKVRSFIIDNQLSNWHIQKNDRNLGWKKNFYKAARLATGEIVFFCDQDDIWLPNKIQKMSQCMISKNMGALFGNKEVIDAQGNSCSKRMTKTNFTSKLTQLPFRKSFYTFITLGCCMCVSKSILDKYIKIGFTKGAHDSQCGRLALLYSTLWYLDEPVIKYRIHHNNTSGISATRSFGTSTLDKRIEEVKSVIEWLYILKGEAVTRDFDFDECISALKKRLAYLNNDAHFYTLLNCMDYYTGFTMLVGDFAYKHKLNGLFGKVRWLIKKG